MFWQVAIVCCCFSTMNDNSLSAEYVFKDEIGGGWSAAVIRNTIIEHFRIEIEESGREGVIRMRGGDLRTDVLTLIMTQNNQPHIRHIAWADTETTGWRGVDPAGFRRPTVEDVIVQDDRLFILHIAESTNKLTVLERDNTQQSPQWATLQTFNIDLSSFAPGQEIIGVTSRIVDDEHDVYLYFRHWGRPLHDPSLQHHIAFKVEETGVTQVVDDPRLMERLSHTPANGN